ncbi:hypothetical protein PR048_033658 [Dryococelus australis]|uniref:Uncharacterized protein n=1 Tax=Dryococelus australis TaxID=614101 RepID=A0ABQ9G0X5_9NEOP|nr:hypothetical protein PR048_033658 [Dryococelus australis]
MKKLSQTQQFFPEPTECDISGTAICSCPQAATHRLTGTFIFPGCLTDVVYLQLLQEELSLLLEDIPSAERRRTISQSDGVPSHFHHAVVEHFNVRFPERWVGRSGFHPCFLDLSPLDYCVWRRMKNIVYQRTAQPREELLAHSMQITPRPESVFSDVITTSTKEHSRANLDTSSNTEFYFSMLSMSHAPCRLRPLFYITGTLLPQHGGGSAPCEGPWPPRRSRLTYDCDLAAAPGAVALLVARRARVHPCILGLLHLTDDHSAVRLHLLSQVVRQLAPACQHNNPHTLRGLCTCTSKVSTGEHGDGESPRCDVGLRGNSWGKITSGPELCPPESHSRQAHWQLEETSVKHSDAQCPSSLHDVDWPAGRRYQMAVRSVSQAADVRTSFYCEDANNTGRWRQASDAMCRIAMLYCEYHFIVQNVRLRDEQLDVGHLWSRGSGNSGKSLDKCILKHVRCGPGLNRPAGQLKLVCTEVKSGRKRLLNLSYFIARNETPRPQSVFRVGATGHGARVLMSPISSPRFRALNEQNCFRRVRTSLPADVLYGISGDRALEMQGLPGHCSHFGYQPDTIRLEARQTGSDSRISICGSRVGRYRWSASLLEDLPFLPPLHSGTASASPHFALIGSHVISRQRWFEKCEETASRLYRCSAILLASVRLELAWGHSSSVGRAIPSRGHSVLMDRAIPSGAAMAQWIELYQVGPQWPKKPGTWYYDRKSGTNTRILVRLATLATPCSAGREQNSRLLERVAGDDDSTPPSRHFGRVIQFVLANPLRVRRWSPPGVGGCGGTRGCVPSLLPPRFIHTLGAQLPLPSPSANHRKPALLSRSSLFRVEGRNTRCTLSENISLRELCSCASKVKKRRSDTGDTNTARLAPHRSYAQGVQCYRRNAVLCKLDMKHSCAAFGNRRSGMESLSGFHLLFTSDPPQPRSVTEPSTLKSSKLAGGWARIIVLCHDRPIRCPLHHEDSMTVTLKISVLENCFFRPSPHLAVETMLKSFTRRKTLYLTSSPYITELWGARSYLKEGGGAAPLAERKRRRGGGRLLARDRDFSPALLPLVDIKAPVLDRTGSASDQSNGAGYTFTLPVLVEVAAAEWLACSPPTKANRVQSPVGSHPDFRSLESCRTMPLISGFPRGSPVSAFHSGTAPF